MKRFWIGTGWKMNHLLAEAEEYARTLKQYVSQEKPESVIFICVPFTALHLVSQILSGTGILVAAQNAHWLDRGAATGEVSPLMAKDAGAAMVEIGHSERREFFGETDIIVNLKIKAALANDLIPLICIGETIHDKNYGVGIETLNKQLKIALHDLTPQQIRRSVIAYEPVWAIGDAGTPAPPDYVELTLNQIKHSLCKIAGNNVGERMPILYGGSVNPENAISFISMPSVDGLFIGRSAWKAEGYISIIRDVEQYCLHH